MRSSRHQSRPVAKVWQVSTPQRSQRSGGPVMSPLDAEMGGNTLAQLRVHGGHAGLAIHRDEALFFSKRFEFFFHLGLVHDERLEQIVGQGHVAARLPVADGMGLAKLPFEGSLGPNVETERGMGSRGL